MATCPSTKIIHGIAVRAAFNGRHYAPRCLRDYGVITPEGGVGSKDGRASFTQGQVMVMIEARPPLALSTCG